MKIIFNGNSPRVSSYCSNIIKKKKKKKTDKYTFITHTGEFTCPKDKHITGLVEPCIGEILNNYVAYDVFF